MTSEEPKIDLTEVKKTHEENMKRLEELDAQLKTLYKMKEQLIQTQKQYDLWAAAEERRLALMRLTPPPFPGYLVGPYYPGPAYYNPGYFYPYTPYPPSIW